MSWLDISMCQSPGIATNCVKWLYVSVVILPATMFEWSSLINILSIRVWDLKVIRVGLIILGKKGKESITSRKSRLFVAVTVQKIYIVIP